MPSRGDHFERARRLPVEVFVMAYALERTLPDDVDRVMAPVLAVLKLAGPSTAQEIAQVLGISDSTVKMRLMRFFKGNGSDYVERKGSAYRLKQRGHAVADAMTQGALRLVNQ